VVRLGDIIMILDLHRQGLSVSAIARGTGFDRKTVRKHIARGLEPPAYGPRASRTMLLDPFVPYLRERVAAFPELTGRRLHRELRERGYTGGYTRLTDLLRDIRPVAAPGFEQRFETPPGRQAQVDFAQFRTEFTDEPSVVRIVWLSESAEAYTAADATRAAWWRREGPKLKKITAEGVQMQNGVSDAAFSFKQNAMAAANRYPDADIAPLAFDAASNASEFVTKVQMWLDGDQLEGKEGIS
jgi:hypothetical protein